MAARTTRQDGRQRIIKSFMDSLDRIIPPEERQADELRKAMVPTLLQERAALDANALVTAGETGNCPRCGSDRIYLDHGGRDTQKEIISPHGPVVIGKQQCRCRACGRSFSPQDREWSLPAEAPLTSQAACRVAREAVTQQGFELAARALSADWALDTPLHP